MVLYLSLEEQATGKGCKDASHCVMLVPIALCLLHSISRFKEQAFAVVPLNYTVEE